MQHMVTACKTVMLKPQDQLAIALIDLPAGIQVTVTCQSQTFTVVLKDPIEFGHKFAVKPVQEGEDILKYGEVIGIAVRDITPGEHIHVHNLEGKRGRGDLSVNDGEQ